MRRRQFLRSVGSTAFGAGASRLLYRKATTGLAEKKHETDPGGMNRCVFFKPKNAWAADFIPYFENGVFHLFYLLDWRSISGHGEGTPWYQVSTNDFIHFTDHGQMLARGTKEEQDLYVFTGSVIEAEGRYHIFYTGHNPYFPKQGQPEEGVMHASSEDLLSWTKIREDTFYAPERDYDRNNWRDPFVFWNQEAGEYWMLLAARLKTGPSRRRGCTALCASKDLKKWDVREPFWTPGLYFTHECPDLFRMGNWWYLVFSEFTDLKRTRYRMSRSLKGPWLTPEYDYFDARAYYAAKTASDGERRFLFGWNPTRAHKKDYYRWDWGGNLVVHELKQENDGTLSVAAPATVDAAWTRRLAVQFPLRLGRVKAGGEQVELMAPGSFACAAAETMPDRCKIEAQIRFKPGTRGCGIMLRTSDDLNASYYLRFEPQNNRLVFDSWPRGLGPENLSTGGYMAGLDRWINLNSRIPVNLKVFVDGTIAVAYVGGRIAMCTRMYDLPSGRWGLFVKQGSALFQNIRITGL